MHTQPTLFFPTSSIPAILKGRTKITPAELYDLSRFVEEYVLSDKIYVSNYFYNLTFYSKSEPLGMNSKDFVFDITVDDDFNLFTNLYKSLEDLDVKNISSEPLRILATEFSKRFTEAFHEEHGDIYQDMDKEELEWGIKNLAITNLVGCSIGIKALLGRLDYHVWEYTKINQKSKRLGQNTTFRKRNLLSILSSLRKMNDIDGFNDGNSFWESLETFEESANLFNIPLSPGYYIVNQGESNQRNNYSIYKNISRRHRVSVEKVERYLGRFCIYIPPLLTILLQRCKTYKDLECELVKLRREFEELRSFSKVNLSQIEAATTLNDKFEILEDYEAQQSKFVETLGRNPKRTFIKNTWDIVKQGTPLRMFSTGIDSFLTWNDRRATMSNFQKFSDLYDLSTQVENYHLLLEKVFGTNNVDLTSFRLQKKMTKKFLDNFYGSDGV